MSTKSCVGKKDPELGRTCRMWLRHPAGIQNLEALMRIPGHLDSGRELSGVPLSSQSPSSLDSSKLSASTFT